jgi:hypothetical protein
MDLLTNHMKICYHEVMSKRQIFVTLTDREKDELRLKAAALDLTTTRGPNVGKGDISKLLSAIANGQLILVKPALASD